MRYRFLVLALATLGHIAVHGQSFSPPTVPNVSDGYQFGDPCTIDAQTLCLHGGYYKVTATYTDYAGRHGSGKAVRLTADTGYFWFFDSANVEAVVKMVPFCFPRGKMAVYATGLTDLGVVLTVTDVTSGTLRTYENPIGTGFQLVRDAPFDCVTFEPAGAAGPSLADLDRPPAEPPSVSYGQGEPLAPCTADATSLCLYGSRFRVTATYTEYGGNTGAGKAVWLTDDTATFWFFDAANVEAVVKIVSFCGQGPNAFAVYANGLTDVKVTLAVTDTQTGRTATYENALGHPFALIRDAAFPCP